MLLMEHLVSRLRRNSTAPGMNITLHLIPCQLPACPLTPRNLLDGPNQLHLLSAHHH